MNRATVVKKMRKTTAPEHELEQTNWLSRNTPPPLSPLPGLGYSENEYDRVIHQVGSAENTRVSHNCSNI